MQIDILTYKKETEKRCLPGRMARYIVIADDREWGNGENGKGLRGGGNGQAERANNLAINWEELPEGLVLLQFCQQKI